MANVPLKNRKSDRLVGLDSGRILDEGSKQKRIQKQLAALERVINFFSKNINYKLFRTMFKKIHIQMSKCIKLPQCLVMILLLKEAVKNRWNAKLMQFMIESQQFQVKFTSKLLKLKFYFSQKRWQTQSRTVKNSIQKRFPTIKWRIWQIITTRLHNTIVQSGCCSTK